jgi:hypothetical protein
LCDFFGGALIGLAGDGTLALYCTGTRTMNFRISALLLALSLAVSAGFASAAPERKAEMGSAANGTQGNPAQQGQRGQKRQPPESYTEETTRKMADGRVYKTKVEQVVGEAGLTRKEMQTNPDGKTATSSVTVTIDKNKRTVTRKMEGVDFDGKAWSRSEERDIPKAPGQAGKAEGKPTNKKPAESKKGG